MQIFIQGHSQASTVFSKDFYNSTQCGSGAYIHVIVLCFRGETNRRPNLGQCLVDGLANA